MSAPAKVIVLPLSLSKMQVKLYQDMAREAGATVVTVPRTASHERMLQLIAGLTHCVSGYPEMDDVTGELGLEDLDELGDADMISGALGPWLIGARQVLRAPHVMMVLCAGACAKQARTLRSGARAKCQAKVGVVAMPRPEMLVPRVARVLERRA
jgi:hypothetical protein